MSEAFVVIHLDTTREPPVVLSAGIYSEGPMSLTGAIGPKASAATVFSTTGDTFALALHGAALAVVSARHVFGWLEQYPGIRRHTEEIEG